MSKIKIGNIYICISNNKKYRVIDIIKYKDEHSNGWIDSVIYEPLYECEIEKFSRSMTMFNTHFYIDEAYKI